MHAYFYKSRKGRGEANMPASFWELRDAKRIKNNAGTLGQL